MARRRLAWLSVPVILLGHRRADTGRQAAFFALGAVVMLGTLGAVLLLVSRRMRPA